MAARSPSRAVARTRVRSCFRPPYVRRRGDRPAPDDVRRVGALPPVSTVVTNYAIYPFVGLIEPGGTFHPNPEEVDAVVELSLPDLVAGFEKRRLIRRGVPIKTDTYTVDGNFIWGATARILGQLLERLKPVL